MSLFEKLKGFIKKDEDKVETVESEPLDDWETRDKSLKALRRLRRRQLDEVERKQLLDQINNFNRKREKEGFYGVSILGKSNPSKKKKMRYLKDRGSFLGKNKGGFFG